MLLFHCHQRLVADLPWFSRFALLRPCLVLLKLPIIRTYGIVGRGHHGWLHWFDYPVPDGGRPNTDIWPDVSEYDPSELYEAPGLRTRSGEKCYLFSSRNQKTVDRSDLIAPNWLLRQRVQLMIVPGFMVIIGTSIGWRSTV